MPIIKMKKKKILFVCKANHFRSVVSEKILKEYRKDMTIKSAGLEVKKVQRTSANASRNAARYGINIKWHRCRQLTAEMAKDSDKIYVFESAHKNYIENKFPRSKGKVNVIHAHEDLKGKPPEAHTRFIKDMRIILKKLSKKL